MMYVVIHCDQCGQNHRVADSVQRLSCCGKIYSTVGLPRKRSPVDRGADFIARFRIDSDRGVGDTVERLIERAGGRLLKRFKMLLESLSINCGCVNRRDWLNEKYPYG